MLEKKEVVPNFVIEIKVEGRKKPIRVIPHNKRGFTLSIVQKDRGTPTECVKVDGLLSNCKRSTGILVTTPLLTDIEVAEKELKLIELVDSVVELEVPKVVDEVNFDEVKGPKVLASIWKFKNKNGYATVK